MNRMIRGALILVQLAACGDAGTDVTPDAAAPGIAAAEPGGAPPARAAATAGRQPLDGRTGELVNPDDSTMVLLYFDVAGITPPLATWVEQDGRVLHAQGADKASLRPVVRQELDAAAAAVRDVGRIRLSLSNANLSHYDPTYGEFTVGALSPGSVIEFRAFGQSVKLRFGNGRTAQLWKVPEAEAQAIKDRIGNYARVQLDALLQVKGVQPGPGDGTLVADILEFELRESGGGTTLARVRVPGG